MDEANRLEKTVLVELPFVLEFELLLLLQLAAKFVTGVSSIIGMVVGIGFGLLLSTCTTGDTTSAEGEFSGDAASGGGDGGGDDTIATSFSPASEVGGAFGGGAFALSSANASQKALCVMKLSLLENRVPQSHLYSLVPQILECAFQSD